MRERSRASGPNRAAASAITSPTTWISPATPSPRRIAAERSSGANRIAEAASTSIRLRSSGIERSPLRSPASTWATGRPGGGPGPGERRVGVAVDEHQCRARGGGSRPQSAASIDGDVRGAEVERDGGLVELELLEEDGRQRGVPVLAGVDDELLDPGVAERHRERRRLDELGPVADDRQQPHRRRLARGRGATRHAVSVARRDLGSDLGHDLDERPRRRRRDAVGVPGDRDQAGRDARDLEHGDVRARRRLRAAARRCSRSRRRRDPGRCRPRPSGRRSRARARASARNGLGALVGIAVGDQRQPGDLARPDRARAPCELGAGGGEQDVGVGEDVDALERRVVVLDHEGEVEVAALEQPEQLLVVAGLAEPHLDVRPALDVAAHRARQQAHAGALEGADAERARLALGERVEVGLGRAHRRRGAAGVPQQPLPGLGRRHRPPARPAARAAAGRRPARESRSAG